MKERRWGRKLIITLKKYKLNSILVRNFLLTALMMTLPLVLTVTIAKNRMDIIVQQEIQETNRLFLERTAETMDTLINQIFSFGYYLANDQELTVLTMDSYETNREEYEAFIEAKMWSFVKIQEYIESVYIYLEDSNGVMTCSRESKYGYSLLEDLQDLSWLPQYEALGEEYYTIQSRIKNDVHPYYTTMVLSLKNCGGSMDGAVVININMKELGKSLGHSIYDAQLFLMINQEGQLCYSNHTQLTIHPEEVHQYLAFLQDESAGGTYEFDGKIYLQSYMHGWEGKWSYILYNPMTMYLERMNQVDALVGLLALVACIAGIVVSYVISIHSYRPIQHILDEIQVPGTAEYMKEAELNENFVDEGDEQIYRNELQYISNMVQNTRLRNNRLKMEADVWMKKLNDSQMMALQSQINPHYLYNTMDAINWDAIEQLGEGNSVSVMLKALAEFLRISLQRSSYLIFIAEEIEHVKLYGEILKGRYGDSIQVLWKINEDILQYKVIRLSLQPLLENAVNHGLRAKRYRGIIKISGDLLDEIVVLSIEDDGVGMDLEECRRLNRQLLEEYDSDSDHVGIRNVNQRIKILFGDEYGINVMSREGGGLAVRLILPKIK